MPYASSIPGTAIAPISSIGSSTIGGSCQPVIDSSSPMSVPIVSGLVNGRTIMWRSVGRWPRTSASSTARASGWSTSSCSSRVGATSAASPST